MASIVAGLGVPHAPAFPAAVKRDGPDCDTARFYRAQAERLAAFAPDVIVMFDTDHLNTFFFDNLPIFAIGVADHFGGPNDDVPALPSYRVPSLPKLAGHLRRGAIAADFDLAQVQEFAVDHSVLVPLHFIAPEMRIPVIPIFVSGHVPPLPSAHRCFALGQAVGRALRDWPEKLRVAIIGSGHFSLDIGSPRVRPGTGASVLDPDWAVEVCDLLRAGRIDELVARATTERMWKAGNIGGELLNWIAMLGALGAATLEEVTLPERNGYAYAVWKAH